jgi:transposase
MKRRAFVGVDLGGQFHQVQVTDLAGERLGKSFRIGRGRAGLAELERGVAAVVGTDCEAVYTIEATQEYWRELVHPLQQRGAEVYLVSPAKSSALRTFYRRHTKTDAIDAQATSRLPVVDAKLRPAAVCAPRWDALRRLVRQSWQLREQMANRKRRIMARVQMVYPGYEGVFRDRYCGASLLFIHRYLNPVKARRLGRTRLATLLRKRAWGKFDAVRAERLWQVVENAPELGLEYDDLQLVVNQDLALLEAEERSQQALRDRIAELYGELDPECRLSSLPGLGEFLAAAITAFVGEPGRYDNADQVVALSGLCPRQKSSAGIDTANQALTQHGDPTLRGCLYLAAEIARHYDPELQAFHRRLTARGKHYKQASCALAAKILRRCFALLRDGKAYEMRHREQVIHRQQEGKTVRGSVHEVAERLNDGSGPSSLEPARYALSPALASQEPVRTEVAAENRPPRKPIQPRSPSSMTSESWPDGLRIPPADGAEKCVTST